MQAIVVRAPGGPEELRLEEVADPEPSSHQVLIEVHASGVNRADVLQRRGLYPPPPGESSVLGLEFAGVVSRVGREVNAVQPGDRVMALLGSGGYAERVCVHERLVLPVPEGFSFEQAAAVPEAFLTAHEALLRVAELAPGERVLIHAGASGVGSAAVQIAREVGAFVLATTRGPSKLELLHKLGVHRPIDSLAEDFSEVTQAESRGVGADVIVDLVGAAYAERNQAALAVGGRWVVVGLLGGSRASIDFARLLTRRQTLRGIVMRSRPLPEKAAIVSSFRRDLWPWLVEGRLQPLLDRVYSLTDARAAHERLETNLSQGKIVLRVR
jgi:putative PIG3 family NAD(P)H quinone oxidoreductase